MVAWLAVTPDEIAEARAEAESLMTDTCSVRRATGSAYDPSPTVQADVTTYDDLFTAPCKVAAKSIRPLLQEVGGRTAATIRTEVHLPVDADPLRADDVIEITATGIGSSAIVGAVYRVMTPVGGTYLTARRYDVREVVS